MTIKVILLHCTVFFFVCSLHYARGYKIGPPVVDNPEICESMFPGHDADPQKTEPPFEIHMRHTCAKNNSVIVSLISKKNRTHFEGFFIQARPLRGGNMTYGEFDPFGDPKLQGLKCRNSPTPKINNALGHNDAKRYYNKTFIWTPPQTGVDGGFQFVATVVHETLEFWLNVKSQPIPTKCAASVLTSPATPLLAATVALTSSASPLLAATVALILATTFAVIGINEPVNDCQSL